MAAFKVGTSITFRSGWNFFNNSTATTPLYSSNSTTDYTWTLIDNNAKAYLTLSSAVVALLATMF